MAFNNNLLELIGNTPIMKLNRVAKDIPANVFVKLEYFNPSGSYKDRMALAMVEAAERGDTWNGKKLAPNGIVCDASAGNTAPAVAFVAALKGYKAKLCIYPPLLRGESTRLKIIDAYAPDVCGCNSPLDYISEETFEAIPEEEKELAWVIAGKKHMAVLEENDDNIVWLDQIYNKYNYIGQKKMGYEIIEQLDGQVDAFGCATGSGATLLGVALALREKGLDSHIFGIVPQGSESYIRLKKNPAGPGEFDIADITGEMVERMNLTKWQTEKSILEVMIEKGLPDQFFQVSAKDARDMANRLCSEEGIYCGMSSGANVLIAKRIAEQLEPGQNVVTAIVDRRDRYLGEYPEEVFVV